MPGWLSFIDVAFVIVVVLFAWGGFQKGFAGQIAHIATALVLGGLLFFAYPHVLGFLGRVFRSIDETYLMWVLVIGLLVLSVFVFILMSKLFASLLKAHLSERSDHVYGLILGTIRGALTALLFMIILMMLGSPRIEDAFRDKSYTGTFVARELVPRIRPHVSRRVWTENEEKIKNRIEAERGKTTRARNIPD